MIRVCAGTLARGMLGERNGRPWEMHGHVGAVAPSLGAFGLASRPGYWARLEGQMGVHLLGLLWLDCNGPGFVLWL